MSKPTATTLASPSRRKFLIDSAGVAAAARLPTVTTVAAAQQANAPSSSNPAKDRTP